MKEVQFPVAVASSVLLVYIVFTAVNVSYALIFLVFLLANVAFVWMIIRILKDGKPSEKSFDDFFYEDYNYKRNNSL